MADDLKTKLDGLDNDIKEGRYKNLYLFFGKEKNLKNDYKNKILDSILSSDDRDMNLSIFNKDNYDRDELINSINSVPFFAAYRVVILDEINMGKYEELEEILSSIPNETIVIALEDKNKDEEEKQVFDITKFKNKSNIKEISTYINFDKATDDIVTNKVLEICNKHNIKISNKCINILNEKCLSDLYKIENETNKLCMYCLDKKEIKEEDINILVSENLEETVFSLIKDLTDKNMTGVQKKYKALLFAGTDDRAIMPLISWQYMLCYEVKLAMEERKTKGEIVALTKQKSYPVEQAMEIARKVPKEKLKQIINMCNDVSIGFNKGDNNFDLLLDKIINL